MVLLTLIDLSASTVIWGMTHIYHAGYWMLYGTPKTETQILLEKQNETLEKLQEEMKDLKLFKLKIEESVPLKR